MRPRERQQWIAETVGRHGQVSVDVLAAELSVSPETIRRDLGRLDGRGVVKKVHGGAKLPRLTVEGTFDERMTRNTGAKRAIAAKVAHEIENGSTVFIDTGSTTLICAQALAATRALTVITNSVGIAQVVAEGAVKSEVYLLGGAFNAGNGETVGPMTIEQIGSFHADVALIAPAAVDMETGIMDADFAEASVAKAMIARASQLIVAADTSKVGRRAAFTVSGFEAIDVFVSDGNLGGDMLGRLAGCGVVVR